MLVVNADDFGLDSRINNGIAECCSNGIVRSVSLAANGRAFEHALSLTRGLPGIGIGVHLCLVNEKSLLPKADIPGLIDESGALPENYRSLFFRIHSRRASLKDIEKEMEAQIRKILDSGIVPTHLDSHQYAHLIPAIFNIVIRLGKKYNISWIRCPQGQGCGPRALPADLFKKMYLALFSRRQAEALRREGLRCADVSCGFIAGGRLNKPLIKVFLENMAAGRADLTCHPGYAPQEEKYRSWGYLWEEEAAALKSRDMASLIGALGIKLVNYAA